MILDSLKNAQRYVSLHPRFAQAFAWCENKDHFNQTDGRYYLDDTQLFAIIESGETIAAHIKKFESHQRYIDIQINLSGPEIMEWIPTSSLHVDQPYNAEHDICFYHQPEQAATKLLVQPHHFAIFWPEDAHKPCCHPHDVAAPYRKLIFKVAV